MLGRIQSTMFPGRSTILSIIALTGALLFSAMEAHAGVILPWAQESPVADLSLPFDGAGSSSAPEQPVSNSPKQHENEGKHIARMLSLDGLAETGGASSPVSGAGGFSASPVVAVLDAPAAPPVARSFRYLREQRLQLPQPPPGELLDPPKPCV